MSYYFDRADAYICFGAVLALAAGGTYLLDGRLAPVAFLLGGISGCLLLVGLIARGVQIGLDSARRHDR